MKKERRHILYEEGMTTKDFLIRREFYGGTVSTGEQEQAFEDYTYLDVCLKHTIQSLKYWGGYTTCSDELFEYSLRGVASIYV